MEFCKEVKMSFFVLEKEKLVELWLYFQKWFIKIIEYIVSESASLNHSLGSTKISN